MTKPRVTKAGELRLFEEFVDDNPPTSEDIAEKGDLNGESDTEFEFTHPRASEAIFGTTLEQ